MYRDSFFIISILPKKSTTRVRVGAPNNIEIKSIIYNVELIINEMIKRKFSSDCINYYKNKNKK